MTAVPSCKITPALNAFVGQLMCQVLIYDGLAMSIKFDIELSARDWNANKGGWDVEVLSIAGSAVEAIYANGARVDAAKYQVEQKTIRWADSAPPGQATATISAPEQLEGPERRIAVETENQKLERQKLLLEQEKSRRQWLLGLIGLCGSAVAFLIGIFVPHSETTKDKKKENPAVTLAAGSGSGSGCSPCPSCLPVQQPAQRDFCVLHPLSITGLPHPERVSIRLEFGSGSIPQEHVWIPASEVTATQAGDVEVPCDSEVHLRSANGDATKSQISPSFTVYQTLLGTRVGTKQTYQLVNGIFHYDILKNSQIRQGN